MGGVWGGAPTYPIPQPSVSKEAYPISYSADIKAEVCHQSLGERDERLAELSGFVHAAGAVSLRGGGALGLVLRTDRAFIARRVFLLLRAEGARPELQVTRGNMGTRAYLLSLGGADAARILAACLMLDAEGRPLLRSGVPAGHARRLNQRRAYVRGAFLGCGSVADPSLGYRAEWLFTRQGFASDFIALLARVGLEAKGIERGEKHTVYISGADRLGLLLGLIGAPSALFRLENARIVKNMRNHVNRQVNADAANLDKTAKAASTQITALETLRRTPAWATLDDGLRALAEARLENPDAALAELGEALSPPLSKSGASHRMRRLMARAREVAGENDGADPLI